MLFKGCQSALKGQISLSLRGLVLSLEPACWKGTSRQLGRRAALGGAERCCQRAWSPTGVSVLYEQRFYWGWWDLRLRSTLHSTFSTKMLHADHRVIFFFSVLSQFAKAILFVCFAAEVKNFFFHHLLFFSHIATEFLMFTCTLADWEISWCIVKQAYHILPSSTSLSLVFHTTLPIWTSLSGLFKLMAK